MSGKITIRQDVIAEPKTLFCIEMSIDGPSCLNHDSLFLNYSSPQWKDDFDNLKNMSSLHRTSDESSIKWPIVKEGYSSEVLYHDSKGFSMLLFTQACYAVESNEFTIYVQSKDEAEYLLDTIGKYYLYNNNIANNNILFILVLYPSIFLNVQITPPVTLTFEPQDSVWILPISLKLGYLYIIEYLNYIQEIIMYNSYYPQLKMLYLPFYSLGEDDFIDTYIKMIISLFPNDHSLLIKDKDDLSNTATKEQLCMKQVGMLFPSLSVPSYPFLSIYQSDQIRASMYSYYHLLSQGVSSFLPNVTINTDIHIKRYNIKSHIVNLDLVKQFFFTKKFQFRYHPISFSTLSSSQIIKQLLITDILVGIDSDWILYSIFLLPYSNILLYSPPSLPVSPYTQILATLPLYYVPIFNYTLILPECKGIYNSLSTNITSFSDYSESCLRASYSTGVYIYPGAMLNHLRTFGIHLQRYKYKYIPYYKPKKRFEMDIFKHM
ncbi:hypothetical protein WA158_004848 [Blastocystis sp. Blastoise]